MCLNVIRHPPPVCTFSTLDISRQKRVFMCLNVVAMSSSGWSVAQVGELRGTERHRGGVSGVGWGMRGRPTAHRAGRVQCRCFQGVRVRARAGAHSVVLRGSIGTL